MEPQSQGNPGALSPFSSIFLSRLLLFLPSLPLLPLFFPFRSSPQYLSLSPLLLLYVDLQRKVNMLALTSYLAPSSLATPVAKLQIQL